ncbi:MAG: hypothetical protein IJS01_13525 [Lentisphaeria bacterium]|nr:hypothetical protein [Lentisphaeria bacterium]
MNACFYIGPEDNEWCLKYFPRRSPGELPIAGKSWVRHAVDQCSCLEALSDIFIVDCYRRDELAARLGQGGYWSLRLHLPETRPCGSIRQLLEAHPEIPADDLMIVWGLVMPDVPDIRQIFSELREVESMPEPQPPGIWLLRGGKLYECLCPLMRIDSLRAYFDLNFRLLEKPGIYNLPGYSNKEGCVFGTNVIILPGGKLEKPVLLSDHVRLERGVELNRQVIAGKYVLINENAVLEHSVIMDFTYIGKFMFFKDKIIDGSRVIDVPTGEFVELEDEFLTASSRPREVSRFSITEFILAVFIAVAGAPLYLGARLFGRQAEKLEFFRYFLLSIPSAGPLSPEGRIWCVTAAAIPCTPSASPISGSFTGPRRCGIWMTCTSITTAACSIY